MNIFDIIPETITCKGIIQVGANIGQELSFFKTIAKNILIFEYQVLNNLKGKDITIANYRSQARA